MMNQLSELGPKTDQIGARKLALEHEELEMVAESAEDLKGFIPPFVVGDVVADQERVAHVNINISEIVDRTSSSSQVVFSVRLAGHLCALPQRGRDLGNRGKCEVRNLTN